jgi:ElaB/YqjD/DUF883 family membrane-anchored ribosome-binding protein
MGKEPHEIRAEIETTRNDMGDTVEALGYKADVKSRAKDSITDKRDRLKETITGATPDTGDVKDGAKRAAGVAQQNPIGLAIGGLAVGLIAGLLIPSTRVENQKLGPIADDVKEKAKETGGEALERGKEVAQEAAQSARETIQEEGPKHAEKMKESVQETARS